MTNEVHQGVVAIVPPFNYCDIEDLEEILDTYNTSYWVTTELVD